MSFRTIEVEPKWQIKTVEELVNEKILYKPLDGNHGGIHPKSTDYVQEGIPFIMANDLVNNKIDFKSCKYITEEQAIGLKKGKAIEGDVLLTHKATMGRTAIVVNAPSDYIVLTPQVTYYRVRNKEVLNNSYLKYYFDSSDFQTLLNAWAQGGSTRSYLGITAQLKLPILIPSLNEQKSIANILSTLDDKIEVNNQINKTLENMAQAIFKQWFLDFEFPINEGETYKSSGGQMVESELGMIPDGWEIKTIKEIVEVTDYVANGSFASLKENVSYTDKENGEAALIRLVDYNNSFKEPYVWVDDKGYNFLKKSVLFGGEIVISNVGANAGTVFKVPRLKYKMTLGPNSIVLLDNEYKHFLYNYFTSFDGQNQLMNIRSGSAQPKFNKTAFRGIKLLLPNKEILNKFNKVYDKFDTAIENNRQEIVSLEKLRDTILPKLMSGEIRVPIEDN